MNQLIFTASQVFVVEKLIYYSFSTVIFIFASCGENWCAWHWKDANAKEKRTAALSGISEGLTNAEWC